MRTISIWVLSLLLAACGGESSSPDTADADTGTADSTLTDPVVTDPVVPEILSVVNAFNKEGEILTISSIANTVPVAASSAQANFTILASAAIPSERYIARFMVNKMTAFPGLQINDPILLPKSGLMEFVVNKQDDGTAYFTDVKLLHLSFPDKVDDVLKQNLTFLQRLESSYAEDTANQYVPDITRASELDLTLTSAGYSATGNHLSIVKATASERLVHMNMDFDDATNAKYFNDFKDMIVCFSNDFTTFAGGGENIIIIGQKVSDAGVLDISNADFNKTWHSVSFKTTVSGISDMQFSVMESLGAATTGLGEGLFSFEGENSQEGYFDGQSLVNDAKSGYILFGYGDGSEGTAPLLVERASQVVGNSTPIHGAFLIAPNKQTAVGYDIVKRRFLAMELAPTLTE